MTHKEAKAKALKVLRNLAKLQEARKATKIEWEVQDEEHKDAVRAIATTQLSLCPFKIGDRIVLTPWCGANTTWEIHYLIGEFVCEPDWELTEDASHFQVKAELRSVKKNGTLGKRVCWETYHPRRPWTRAETKKGGE